MRPRRDRLARIVVSLLWAGGLALALRLGIAAADPTEALALLIAVYLSLWGLIFFLRPNSTTSNAARFFLVTLGIGLALVVAELPALFGRVDYRDIFQTPTASWRRHHHRPDPELIYVREGNRREQLRFTGGELAGLSGVGTKTIYQSDVTYDADGFRNPTVLNHADVVVLGDSFVEGLHVRDSEVLTAQLSKATNLSVANLGRSGDGPQQERYILQRFGIPKRPKVCVWMFYEGNDLEDAAEYEANRAMVTSLGPITLSRQLYERSFLRNALMFARRTWLAPQKRKPASQFQGIFPSRDHGEITMTFASADHHRRPDANKLQKAATSLQDAQAACDASGVKFVVAFVPTKLRACGESCRFPTETSISLPKSNELASRLRESLGDIAFVDLTPAFREAATRGELLYLPDDTHWSSAGHALAAQELARFLATHGDSGASASRR